MSAGTGTWPVASSWSRLRAGALTLALFSLAHFLVDIYSGSIGVLQPFLVARYGLNLSQAGLIGGLLVFSTSVTQPIYGYLSDRYRSKLFSCLGPAVAGLFILGATMAPGYGTLLVLMMLGGAGVSAFHPQGSSWSTAGMRGDRGGWMAIFISAGTLGMALSPAFFKEVIQRIGFEHLVWASVPGVLLSAIMLVLVKAPGEEGPRKARSFDWASLRAVRGPMTILYLGVFFRSVVQVTYGQFLILYLNRERHYSLHDTAYLVTLYLSFGAVGGFLGGHLAERFGAKRIIVHSFLWSVPCMAAFFLVPGPAGLASLILGGFILLFTIPVNVVVAQQLVPSQAATVSALLMGFAWGMAGMLFIPITGWVADHASLHVALFGLLVFPAMGFVLTRRLPEEIGR